jgi:hypothetical protein
MPSSLSYVTIRGAVGVRRDGWTVPGGLTFDQNPVTLSHCRLIDVIAPAALFVSHTHFGCEESEFGRVSAQALRVEYAEGRVDNCRFHDVLGDAVALRGSRVEVRDISLLRIYDSGISAKQNSVATVRGGRAENVGIAVTSSDASHIHLEGMLIQQAWTAGLAAYTSESGYYGPSSIHASEVTFASADAMQALVQPGSSVRLEGAAARAQELDAQRLSWRQGITTTIHPLGYRLGPSIWLAGYALESRVVAPSDPLRMTLYWRTDASLDRDYTVFIHIRDAEGETVVGWDTMPRENTYPTTQWQAGQVVDDGHTVPLDISSGEYRIALGMYHLASGQRLRVVDSNGKAVADDTILLGRTFRVD